MDYPEYFDHKNNRVIFVHNGLSRDEYGTFYTSNGAGYHRVKSNVMPMTGSREQAQKNLDIYAAKNGFKEHCGEPSKMNGKIFFTKCCKEFRKNTTASTTGYEYDLNDPICMSCPFAETIYRYKNGVNTPVHECRAGEKYCNENDYWTTNINDKTTLYIRSLDWSWIEKVKNTVVKMDGVMGASYNQDLSDCRKNLSIAFYPNKKGLAAKKKIVDMYFNSGGVDPMPKDGVSSIKRGILAGLEEMEDINNSKGKAASENSENIALNIIDSKEIVSFDYSAVDEDTASFLQQKEAKITQIRMMSVMAIGKELKEVHDRLANNKTGTFGRWCESIGMSRRSAENYIQALDYIAKNFRNIEDAEKIQPSLLFAISKPSAPPELQEQVISGDITTHKQYKDLEEKLKAAEKEASEAKAKAETERNAWQKINESYNRLEKVNHEHYEKARELEKELKAAKEQLLEAQSSGDSEEVERLKQLLQDTENELEDSKKRVEELESGLDDDNEIVAAVVDWAPDEVLEELAELRNRSSSIEACAELKTLLKVLNGNILSLGKLLSTIKEDNNIAMECISHVEQIKENMLLIKKISFENLKTDLFDFIKD